MARDRVADEAQLREIDAAVKRNDHAAAAALATRALDGGLEHPLVLNLAALQLERAGKVADAVPLLSRAIALAPDDVGLRNALGVSLLRLERPAQALAQFDALLALQPGLAFAHVNRANALRRLGSFDAAVASFRRAHELDPNDAVAIAGLADVLTRLAAFPEAREWADKALRLLPGFPPAIMSLAAVDIGEGAPARAEERLLALLADARLGPVDRANAFGQLGDAYDAAERPADAMRAYTACNDELRRLYGASFGPGPSALDYARKLGDTVAREQPASWARPAAPVAHGPGATGHVFVLGFPRSGTTLIRVMLSGHPAVVSLAHRELLLEGVREFLGNPNDLSRLTRAPAADLARVRDRYWAQVAAAGVEVTGKLFVDEHSLNTLKLPLIARLFPDAKVIFACRDPRDVILSCFRRRFTISAPTYQLLSIDTAARYFDTVMRLTDGLTRILPLNSCLVRHEDLIGGFSREMKRICAFLGIEWIPTLGDAWLQTGGVEGAAPTTAQLMRRLDTEGTGHWLRYQAELAPVLPVLAPWVERFGYQA